ncbi:MAG: PepSY domain-containing protein [Gammaproteobacteria bacterium]|nr:PepSY domain-containing protein [Gammaproteobacteria bacterium]
MTRNHKKPFPYFLWHRRLGLLAMALMIILAVTGILLNHTESLHLDDTAIGSNTLLNWYGLNPKGEIIQFSAGHHTLSQWDRQIFFNSQPLISSNQQITGFITIDNMYIASLENIIMLIDNNGELIEQIDTQYEFSSIKRLGIHNRQLVVTTGTNQLFQADQQIIAWQQNQLENPQWSSQNPVSEQQQNLLKQAYRGQGLMLERVILDLHSGRIFNDRWGIYLMDASAIIIIWLSISGTWVWYSRKQKQKIKRHYQKHHK